VNSREEKRNKDKNNFFIIL